jgi:hypothetical protein
MVKYSCVSKISCKDSLFFYTVNRRFWGVAS